MESTHETLATIYEIVKSDPAPHTCLVSPHEIILKQTGDWSAIQNHLELLAAEQLIIIKKFDKIVVSITQAGIAKAKSLRNNFINKNFLFPTLNQDEVSKPHN